MQGVLIALIIGGTISVSMYFAYLSTKGKRSAEDPTEGSEGVAGLRQELQGVRQELAELAERVDFTERLLAQQREAERLDPPKR
jgi:hypothetical protein